jgi:hypothetical protein
MYVNGRALDTLSRENVKITALNDMLGKVLRTFMIFDRPLCSGAPTIELASTCLETARSSPITVTSIMLEYSHGITVTLSDSDKKIDNDGKPYLIKKIPNDPSELGSAE